MEVEFRDRDGLWYPIRGAKAQLVFPNSYHVTFQVLPIWFRRVSMLETMAFRIQGRLCSRAYVESSAAAAPSMMMLVA